MIQWGQPAKSGRLYENIAPVIYLLTNNTKRITPVIGAAIKGGIRMAHVVSAAVLRQDVSLYNAADAVYWLQREKRKEQ